MALTSITTLWAIEDTVQLKSGETILIQGGAGDSVIFRVPDDANMLVTQTAILVGDGGIGLNNVMFYSDKPDNNTHFSLSNVVLNGIAFWDLSMFPDPSEIGLNNVQGCTQLVGNKINTGQNVRLTRCAFAVDECTLDEDCDDGSQVSTPLQNCPSSHTVSSATWSQESVVSLHESAVQLTPSSQSTDVPD